MKQRIIFEIIQDFFVSTVLTLVAALVSGAGISFVPFVLDVLFAWLVNLIIGFAVPEKRIGEFLAQKLKLNKTLSFLFVLLVIVVINVVGISACVVLKTLVLIRCFSKFGVVYCLGFCLQDISRHLCFIL